MSGSHHAPEPPRDSRYDCRTATERERDELDVLRLEYETLREANAYQSRRMTTLEATVAALEDVISQHVLACNIKSMVLRMEDDGR